MDETSTFLPRSDAAVTDAASLRYIDREGRQRYEVVQLPKYRLGRGAHNDLVFREDLTVSRNHAVIELDGGQYILKDSRSRLGTFVNGEKIEAKVLRHGDRIQLGGHSGPLMTFFDGDLLESLSGLGSLPGESYRITSFRELGLLLGTLRKLNSISILDDVMRLVLDTAIEVTRCERGFIILRDQEGKFSYCCARDAQQHDVDEEYVEVSRRVPEMVMKSGRTKVIAGLAGIQGHSLHSSIFNVGIRSVVCVPLRYMPRSDPAREFTRSDPASYVGAGDSFSSPGPASPEILGVLYIDSRSAGIARDRARIHILETLADETASAIYNARLVMESRARRKLLRELEFARRIQWELLPPSQKILPYLSAHTFNLPCRQVGGDYMDFFDLEGGRLGFAMGDVSGKGYPAALMAARAQGIFCTQASCGLEIPAMIARINCCLTERKVTGSYLTLFYGVVDPEGCCAYTNAGHNPPYVLRTDGSLYELTEGGVPLGMFPGMTYGSGVVTLAPGDHLVLFTDGVVEARNGSGEEYGKERLQSLLKGSASASSSDILDRLQESLVSFSSDAPQYDDISIMILGYRDS